MKKIYLILFLLLPVIGSAQVSLGITAGSNIGKFGGVEPPDATYASRVGLNLGGTIAYRFNQDISLIFQPMYSQRGSDIEVGEDTRRDSLRVYETRVNFLILPVFIRVDADNGVTYFISGLEFGIPLAANLTYEGKSSDISYALNNLDILASIGMGIRFSMGEPDLLIEFRYYQGLVNFNSGDEHEDGNILLDNFKNSGFQLMAGMEWAM